MKKIIPLIITLGLLAALGAAAVAAWQGIGWFVQIMAARASVSDAVLLVCLTALLGALGIASSIRWAKRREREHRLGDLRLPIYENLIMAWRGALNSAEANHASAASALPEDVIQLEGLLALRGSAHVISGYQHLRQLADDPETAPQELQAHLVALLTEMRRDLGAYSYSWNEKHGLETLLWNRSRAPEPNAAAAPFPGNSESLQDTPHRPAISLSK